VHRSARSVDLEILDPIPVEEITSIRLESTPVVGADTDSAARASLISRCFGSATALFTRARARTDDPISAPPCATGSFVSRMPEQPQRSDRGLFRSYAIRPSSSSMASGARLPKPATIDGYCEPILKISTKPGGFNRGQAYHFLLLHQDHPWLDAGPGGDGGAAARRPLRGGADAEALAARLDALAARRRGEHARETRFLRLQAGSARGGSEGDIERGREREKEREGGTEREEGRGRVGRGERESRPAGRAGGGGSRD
jgi:hypothetical protein